MNQRVHALVKCRRTHPNWGAFKDVTDAIKDQEIKDQDSVSKRFRIGSLSQSSTIRIKDRLVWIKDQRSGQELRNGDQGFRVRIKDQSFLYEYKVRSLLDFNLSWAPGG